MKYSSWRERVKTSRSNFCRPRAAVALLMVIVPAPFRLPPGFFSCCLAMINSAIALRFPAIRFSRAPLVKLLDGAVNVTLSDGLVIRVGRSRFLGFAPVARRSRDLAQHVLELGDERMWGRRVVLFPPASGWTPLVQRRTVTS